MLVVLGLGAVLGILLLFKSGLYPGHQQYSYVVSRDLETQKSLYNNLLLSKMAFCINRELFPVSIVTSLKTRWKEYKPSIRDQWLESTVDIRLTDAAPNNNVKLPIDEIAKALGELASASRFPKWEVISVSTGQDREVNVKYRWSFKPSDIYSPATDGIVFDVMARLGLLHGEDSNIDGFPSFK